MQGVLQRNPYDELEELQLLGADYFPTPTPAPPPFPDRYDDEEEQLRRLQARSLTPGRTRGSHLPPRKI